MLRLEYCDSESLRSSDIGEPKGAPRELCRAGRFSCTLGLEMNPSRHEGMNNSLYLTCPYSACYFDSRKY
jgi:hypothetical protein